MAEIIDLEEYRNQKAENEIRELKEELEYTIRSMGIPPVEPEPYYPPLDDFSYSSLSYPLAGSLGCPCCGSPPWNMTYEIDKNES